MSKEKVALCVLPSLRKRFEGQEERRLQRLREAKANKDIKHITEAWAERELAPKILSDQQRMAIYLLTDFHNKFSDRYIYTRLGISSSTFFKWRNDPFFLKALDKELDRRRSFMRLHAFKNVSRAIERGDMKATWNYLKMTGDLKENHEIVDRTGEREMSDEELGVEIHKLQTQLTVPSAN